MSLKSLSYFMTILVVLGSFAPFATAQQFNNPQQAGFSGAGNYGSITNTYQSSRPSFGNFYSGSYDTYWPILNNLQKDQCDAVNSDFIIGIPPGGCSPMVVRSDLLAEQNVPVFCQLSAIRVNPLIDVSTIKSISFKGDYPDEVAGISFHPARAAVRSYKTLLGDPIDENIGYVVIVLKRQPDERNLEEYISGMLTATVRYDAKGAFGTGAAEYYLEPMSNDDWDIKAAESSFWSGKGHLRVIYVGENEATIEVMTDKNDVYRTVTLKEGETSNRIYYPGQYCTAAMKLKLNKIDNSADMAKINIDGDTFWVRQGSRLLGGKCVVRDLNVFPGGSGTIEISCSGNSRFTLRLGDSGVILKNESNKNVNIGIGGMLKSDKNEIYLGYYGRNGAFKDKNNTNGEFAVLFDRPLSEDDVGLVTGIFEVGGLNSSNEMKLSLDRISKFKNHYEIIEEGEKGNVTAKGITVVSIGFDSESESYLDSTFIPQYLEEGEDAVNELIELFPSEKTMNKVYWGEEALKNQIALAGRAKDEGMQIDLISKFLTTYPGSNSVEYMRNVKLNLERFDHAESSANVVVNNDDYNIRVDGFASGSGANDAVTIRIGGGTAHTIHRDRTYDIVNDFNEINDSVKDKVYPRLTVVDIDGSSAKFTYHWKTSDGKTPYVTESIAVSSSAALGDRQFSVTGTKVREVAYVSLLPEVRNTKTEANFTFNIGIEKRAFELSPDKANRKIARLNKSIADWEEKIEKLGKLIKGMKAACLATSTILTLKSFISGFSGGAAIARGKVMDVYEAKCRENFPEMDQQKCFSTEYKGEIEASVAAYGSSITAVNDKVQGCTSSSAGVSTTVFKSEVVDSKKYVDSLKACENGVSDGWSVKIGKTTIKKENLNTARDFQAVMFFEAACKSGDKVACDEANRSMRSVLGDNVDMIEASKLASKLNIPQDSIYVDDANAFRIQAAKATEVVILGKATVKKGEYYKVVKSGNNELVYILNDTGIAGGLKVDRIYENDRLVGGTENATRLSALENKYTFIAPVEGSDSCSNLITSPHVRYYEEGNKQGFAATVPVDGTAGWYAFVDNKYYDSNGDFTAFEICNVGPDGVMGQGEKSGDRPCQLFFASSADSVDRFMGCTEVDVRKLYNKARTQIQRANKNGNGVDLDGNFINSVAPLGPSSTGMECTDFMSVADCNLMFNVCDPVICPTSRCDLGGKFPVSDVIASGIIGSIALCLPNFGTPAGGGVIIPVCLSGIHAGLDTYVSILKSHKQCLEENVESGVYTGICDEITAVYTCEFFWGQFAPILDVLLVSFVGRMTGGGQTKGGAEYMTIQKSFDNLDKSIDYFSNTYMTNSFRAFNLRNTEEIGSTVCKGFIGSSVPTSADAIDSFLEPESPAQFNAHFTEDIFSDATVPSTSHYKVFYHIYAGNDRGAQFRVYLRNPPASSYYSSRQTMLVKSGYAAKGVAATESIDFTAPSGYQELCVSINGQDECGFGKVSSSFALNYAAQAYVADQANDKNIDSTEDCVTTSTSAWALATPNIQAGVEQSLGQDDISSTGIVRICASANPDKGVIAGNDVYCNSSIVKNNPKCAYGYDCVGDEVALCKNNKTKVSQVSQGKWIDVGRCDGDNMVCWLDSTSVKENLGQYLAVNDLTVNELIRDSEDLKELDEQYRTVSEKIKRLRDDVKKMKGSLIDDSGELMPEVAKIVKELDEVIGSGDNIGQGSNAAKAEALSLKISVYGAIVENQLAKNPDLKTQGSKPVAPAATAPAVTTEDIENMVTLYMVEQKNKKNLYFVNNGGWFWSLTGVDDWKKVSDKSSIANAISSKDLDVENAGPIQGLASENEDIRIKSMGINFDKKEVSAASIGFSLIVATSTV